MAMNEPYRVEVAYASVHEQCIIRVDVMPSATIESAIALSGILVRFPEIDLRTLKVGVFSKPRQLSDTLEEGDRIEIYRPLRIDPKDARRARAKDP